MTKFDIQFFGGRGSGGGKGGRGGGGGKGRSGGGVAGSAANTTKDLSTLSPIDRIEAQVNATETRIQQLKQQQGYLDSQIRPLVRARNYDQIKANNRESERLDREINNLEKQLSDLHKRGKALSRD